MDNQDPIIREASMKDCSQVQILQKQSGLEADSPEDWKRIWEENPSRDKEIPTGWVLECDSKIVGFLGNVALTYDLAGKPIRAVAGRGWAVDPLYRSHTVKLLFRYMAQKNVDIILNSSSNEAAFKIFSAFGSQVLPLDVYGKILFWIVGGRNFFRAAFEKLNIKKSLARPMGDICGTLFKKKQFVDKDFLDRRFERLCVGYEFKMFKAGELNGPFDKLWSRKVAEKRRFLANRQSRILNWHFSRKEKCVKIIGCYKEAELLGYIAVIRKVHPSLGYARQQVIDLFVLQDDQTVVELLLIKAHQVSRTDDVDTLEVVGFPENIQGHARQLRAMGRSAYPTPFTFKLVNRQLVQEEFLKKDLWYPCFYDGDSSL